MAGWLWLQAGLSSAAGPNQVSSWVHAQADVVDAPDVPEVPIEIGPQRTSAGTLVVLILTDSETGLSNSEVYADMRKVLEANTTLDVMPLDRLSLATREGAIRECAGKAACFARKVVEAGLSVDLLLTLSADKLDEGLLLGFRLVDVKNRTELGASGEEVPVGMTFLGAVEKQFARLFPENIWGQVSDAVIETEPPEAEVHLGERSCVSPCRLSRLKPGVYRVEVLKNDYLPWQGEVRLEVNQATTVRAELVQPESESLWSNPWFWGIGGAVLVGGAVAAAVLLSSSGDPEICVAPSADLCP
jgi:hypothetical protein